MTDLPRHLTEQQVEQYARESETLLDFSRKCRVGRGEAKRLLKRYDLKDEVKRATKALLE